MADYNSVESICDGVDNATQLVTNTKYDDNNYTAAGTEWLTFKGVACSNVYANGNSWIGLGSDAEHVKVDRRDAAMWNLWREEGTLYGYYRFLRFRWDGYTVYNQTGASYKLTYDVVMFDTGDIMLHMVNIPTSNNDGVYALVSAVTQTFTAPTVDAPYESFKFNSDGTYTLSNAPIDIEAPYDRKYLIGSGANLYTVQDDALVEIQSSGTIEVPMRGKTTGWIDVNTNLIKRTDDKATCYSYPLTAGETYTVRIVEKPDRWRVATSAQDSSLLAANSSIPITRVLENKTTVPNAGYTYSFTAQENDNYLCLHVSANNQNYVEQVTYEGSMSVVAIFQQYGLDAIPDTALMLTLANPSLLFWQDSDDALPALSATLTGHAAEQQAVISDELRLDDATTLGIESVSLNASGSPLFAVSFDGGEFKVFSGGVWINSDNGMTANELLAITADQWNAAIAGVSYIKLRAILTSENDVVTNVTFKLKN